MRVPVKERGFTLVEVLIVLLLLFILAGIAVSSYSNYVKRSEAIVTLANVKDALKLLAADTHKWPGGADPNTNPPGAGPVFTDLTANDVGLFNSNGTVFAGIGWDGPYVPLSKLDQATSKFLDPWGTPYFMDYDFDIDGQAHMVIGSAGPDKSGVDAHDDDNIYVILGD